jgi:hypothetical protein
LAQSGHAYQIVIFDEHISDVQAKAHSERLVVALVRQK